MDSNVVPGVVLVAVGLGFVGAAIADWSWFMEGHRARAFVSLFGRTGARVFYVVLGLSIAATGVAAFFPR